MDNHTRYKEQEDKAVFVYHLGYQVHTPCTANLSHHVFGGVPCHLIGFGGVEVGAGAEEKSGEGDEDKGQEDSPGAAQPFYRFATAEGIVDGADQRAEENDSSPDNRNVEYGQGIQIIDNGKGHEGNEAHQHLLQPCEVAP